jgi:beta-galactosidase
LERKAYLAATVFTSIAFSVSAQLKKRIRLNFNEGWKFILYSARQYNDLIAEDATWRTFKISGAGFIAGVDSGDPISHESFKGDKHTALNGLALAILQSNGKKGKIQLTAASDGLESSTLSIEAK